MEKEYVPWSEARPTISHAVKEPELTLLWKEFNSPAPASGSVVTPPSRLDAELRSKAKFFP